MDLSHALVSNRFQIHRFGQGKRKRDYGTDGTFSVCFGKVRIFTVCTIKDCISQI